MKIVADKNLHKAFGQRYKCKVLNRDLTCSWKVLRVNLFLRMMRALNECLYPRAEINRPTRIVRASPMINTRV
jgi:hypothetical protein